MKQYLAYTELYRLCKRRSINTTALGKIIDRSAGYCQKRFRGEGDWSSDDIAKLCKALALEPDDIPILFPLSGKYAGSYERQKASSEIIVNALAEMIKNAVRDELRGKVTSANVVIDPKYLKKEANA